MIFDKKMEDLRRKETTTFASVVSCETVRITLTLAGLNDLQVKVSDIENAYITAPCTEKNWTVLGPEFGSDAGKSAIVVRALYGLKSAGASFLGLCPYPVPWSLGTIPRDRGCRDGFPRDNLSKLLTNNIIINT
jgi:hypothetical protein